MNLRLAKVRWLWLWLTAVVLGLGAAKLATAQETAESPIERLEALLPAAPEQFTPERTQGVLDVAPRVERWAVELAAFQGLSGVTSHLRRLEDLLTIKDRTDQLLKQALELRTQFVTLPAGPERRERLRGYLQVTASLIDLSGRLRYLLFDATAATTDQVEPQTDEFNQLVDLLTAHHSSIGAAVVVDDLFVPPANGFRRAREAAAQSKLKLLRLIAATRQVDLLPQLASFVRAPETSPELVLAAAVAIRYVGLPQEPPPGVDPTLPKPAITARSLETIVQRIDPRRLSSVYRQRREELLAWLKLRRTEGITDDSYRIGPVTVRPGDWLLMRNPSPYNLFTDLSPGLFTHVGVVTTTLESDGVRRMVLVDLPERGKVLGATNIDTFVKRTLHYVVLRHEDPEVGKVMAQTARQTIGNPTEFDLNFRTSRVESLRGKPLAGQKIHTYCAGYLLLCAQETNAPRSDFFPIPEFPAGGKTVPNLAKLGLSFGKNFISPTGALFSPSLLIVGRREAMYEPGREVEQTIFDHFADRLIDSTLIPSPDLFQSLRLKLAEAGKTNPLLAKALAEAAGVNANIDLVSAAKAAAVVESLDEIAQSNRAAYHHASLALRAGPVEELSGDGYSSEEIAAINAYRKRHADLHRKWAAGQLSPRNLRIELVRYYIAKGRRQLDERFFHTDDSSR